MSEYVRVTFVCGLPAMSYGAWKLTCCSETYSNGAGVWLATMPSPWDITGNDPFMGFIVAVNGSLSKYRKRPNIARSSPGATAVTGLRSAASSTQAIGVALERLKRSRSLPEVISAFRLWNHMPREFL